MKEQTKKRVPKQVLSLSLSLEPYCVLVITKRCLDDVAFFVGASTWGPGQLAKEIDQGYWLPCRGPPEIALTGICEHENMPPEMTDAPTATTNGGGGGIAATKTNNKRPLADLWLSMMSACGEDEAKLAHLFFHEEELDDEGLPCDIW